MIKLIDLLQEGTMLQRGKSYIVKDEKGIVIDDDATFDSYAQGGTVAYFQGVKGVITIPVGEIDKRVSPQK